MDALTRYDWPGNVRELENLMERLVVLSASRADRSRRSPEGHPVPGKPVPFHGAAPDPRSDQRLSDLERARILDVLDSCGGGNKKLAASRLGIHAARSTPSSTAAACDRKGDTPLFYSRKAVADAKLGQQQLRPGGVVLDLLAELGHVHANMVGLGSRGAAPDLLQDLAVRDDAAGCLARKASMRNSVGVKRTGTPCAGDLAPFEVDRERADRDDRLGDARPRIARVA